MATIPNPADTFVPIMKGMALTMKHYAGMLFARDKTNVTIQYPEERREQFPRTRWRHVLTRYDNGLEKCIGCSLCAGACPARCIYVQAAENTDEARFSPGERYAVKYEINMLRCIFCGYCQDACPTGAIVLRKDFELSSYTREDNLFTKEMLLEPLPPSAIGLVQPASHQDFRTAGVSKQTNVP
jgi:NADH-quinone oxidoreductase subunit I